MPNDKLKPDQIAVAMRSLNQWSYNPLDSSIVKEWQFESFKTAIAMLVKVSDLAESQNHHPEILSRYTRVLLKLTTHDAQGLTRKDFALAQAIDKLVAQDFAA
jgi:4a-hydroxytetrahydrobiopterin dehydratase